MPDRTTKAEMASTNQRRSSVTQSLYLLHVSSCTGSIQLISAGDDSLTQLTLCTSSFQHWLWHNRLLLNTDKSHTDLFGATWHHLARPVWPAHIVVSGSGIKMSDHLQILRVMVNSLMTFDTQVTMTVKACNFQTFLWQLRSSLSRDVAQSVACSSLDRGWITATLCITACQILLSKDYKECRMLLHELFAKLHDVNITQSTY